MLRISELSRLTLTSAWAEVRRVGKREALALRGSEYSGYPGYSQNRMGHHCAREAAAPSPGAGYRDRDATERSEASASK
jgi:hypothetical protein